MTEVRLSAVAVAGGLHPTGVWRCDERDELRIGQRDAGGKNGAADDDPVGIDQHDVAGLSKSVTWVAGEKNSLASITRCSTPTTSYRRLSMTGSEMEKT